MTVSCSYTEDNIPVADFVFGVQKNQSCGLSTVRVARSEKRTMERIYNIYRQTRTSIHFTTPCNHLGMNSLHIIMKFLKVLVASVYCPLLFPQCNLVYAQSTCIIYMYLVHGNMYVIDGVKG